MSGQTALLEIGVESLPARFLFPALEQLKSRAEALLAENRLGFGSIETLGTPMRLALVIHALPAKSAPQTSAVSGPPARLWRDAAGAFTKQAEGFARAQGVRPEGLSVRQTPKGEFLFAEKHLPGEPASAVLARVFPALIAALEFPKTMVWEESRFRFARPIRWLVALHGRRVVPFALAGVRSGNKTRGLAAAGGKPAAVPSAERYAALLRDLCVLADPARRREALERSLASAAKRSSGALDLDAELLEKVLCLTEHPVAVLGSFDRAYLELPKALLETVLKRQLLFFPVLGKGGALEPDFVGVRDGISEAQREIRVGYERVLAARFADARFFFGRDRAGRLEEKLPRLNRVGFQKGLGSMGQKAARVAALAEKLAEEVLQETELDVPALRQAARLAYADLVAEVVGEFPELQGTMGGVYARLEGLPEKVARALEEFYFPVSAAGPLPATTEGCLVSLAGKLDTLAAMFAAGFVPSGSEDPFALRRVGNGVVRILLERQLPLELPRALEAAVGGLPALDGLAFDRPQTLAALAEFLWQRVESFALEKGYRVDELHAVREGGLRLLPETFARLAAVHAVRGLPDFVPLAQAFKRAANILKQAGADGGEVEPELFAAAAEKSLFAALCSAEGEVRTRLSEGRYEDGLRSLVRLKPEVDLFFEQVLVMAQDEKVKANRLGLLGRLVRLFKSVADISHIQN